MIRTSLDHCSLAPKKDEEKISVVVTTVSLEHCSFARRGASNKPSPKCPRRQNVHNAKQFIVQTSRRQKVAKVSTAPKTFVAKNDWRQNVLAPKHLTRQNVHSLKRPLAKISCRQKSRQSVHGAKKFRRQKRLAPKRPSAKPYHAPKLTRQNYYSPNCPSPNCPRTTVSSECEWHPKEWIHSLT